MPKTQQFSVQVSKTMFHSPALGYIKSRDPVFAEDAQRYGLGLVLVYALVHEGLNLRFQQYAPWSQPLNPAEMLRYAWTDILEFRGVPELFKVSVVLDQNCPGLRQFVEAAGSQYQPVKGDKSYSGNLAQSHTRDLLGKGSCPNKREKELVRFFTDWLTPEGVALSALPHRALPPNLEVPHLSLAVGDWAKIGQNSLPRGVTLQVTPGSETDLGELEVIAEPETEESELLRYIWIEAGGLVQCWPGGLPALAHLLSVRTAYLRQGLIRGDDSGGIAYRLACLLKLRMSEEGWLETHSSYVLRPQTAVSAIDAYDLLSGGGDLEFSSEVVPSEGADPSWRYLVFSSYAGNPSIMMFERGSKLAGLLDGNKLINYAGLRLVPNGFYREMVHLCAKVNQPGSLVVPAVTEFFAGHRQTLERLAEFHNGRLP